MKIPLNSSIYQVGLLNKCGLYKIINKKNGHWYIGSTIMSFARRLQTHRGLLRKGIHANPHLQNAYNKFGEDSFIFEIVKYSYKNSFIREEQRIIDRHLGKPYFYNISKDASAPMTGRHHSPESIIKIRASSRKRAKEIGECTRRHRLGTKHTAKTIRKMKKSALKRDDSKRIAVLKSLEVRQKISKTTKGRKRPPEVLAKMKVIQQSKSYRRKMSLIKKGICPSEETKKKMSIAILGRQVTLINDDGKKEDIISLRLFSKKYKINREEVSKLIRGIRQTYKGWQLAK